MKIIVHEILTAVSQILTPSENTIVSVLRPHIYVHNKPVGTLKVQISTVDDELIAESNEIDIQTMTTLPYFHGYVRFDVNAFLKANVQYKVSVVAGGGYSFSETGYCGVCNDFDLRKYETDVPVTHPRFAPLDVEVWSLSLK